MGGCCDLAIDDHRKPICISVVWEEKNGRAGLPKVDADLLDSIFAKVFLLSVGTVPFWLLLYPFTNATTPSAGQYANVALIAHFSGVTVTTLFCLPVIVQILQVSLMQLMRRSRAK